VIDEGYEKSAEFVAMLLSFSYHLRGMTCCRRSHSPERFICQATISRLAPGR